MPKDEWQKERNKKVTRLAREVEGNINHPNRFRASQGSFTEDEREQRSLKEMVGRFNLVVGDTQDGKRLSADFISFAPLVEKLLRPTFPEIADALAERKPHENVTYPRKNGRECTVNLTASQFLKLAAAHGYNPSLKLEMTDALAEEWRTLGGSGQARG